MNAFRHKYGIPATAVLELRIPPKVFANMGFKPHIRLPIFGEYSNFEAFRDWCANNFAHDHNVGCFSLYDSSKTRIIGYDVTVTGDPEDLLLLRFTA